MSPTKKRKPGRPPIGKPRSIRVSDKEWKLWKTAAKCDGVELSEWIRDNLTNEAEVTINMYQHARRKPD